MEATRFFADGEFASEIVFPEKRSAAQLHLHIRKLFLDSFHLGTALKILSSGHMTWHMTWHHVKVALVLS